MALAKTTQYNNVNVKLSNSQLNKLKLITKNTAEVDGVAMGLLLGPVPANIFMTELETIIDTFVKKILRLSSNMIGNSNDETNFPLKLVLPDRQVARLPTAFVNNSTANKNLSKTQTSKINTTT